MKHLIILLLILICSFGCKTIKYDVSTVYDGAITNFQKAKDLEIQSIEAQKTLRLSEFNALILQLEQISKSQLKNLIISRWNPSDDDFQQSSRNSSHRAILGIGDSEVIDFTKVQFLVGGLSKTLGKQFDYKNTSNTAQSITAYDLLVIPNDVDGLTGVLEPNSTEINTLKSAYKLWLENFDSKVLNEIPVIKSVTSLKDTFKSTLESDETFRKRNAEAIYSALIGITNSARTYSGALTENYQFVSFANSLAKMANSLISGSTN